MPKPLPEWSRRIKTLRQRRRLTQAALGKVLGVTKKVVADWEQGRQQPSAHRYIQLAKLAGGEQALWLLDQVGLDHAFLASLMEDFNARG